LAGLISRWFIGQAALLAWTMLSRIMMQFSTQRKSWPLEYERMVNGIRMLAVFDAHHTPAHAGTQCRLTATMNLVW
jgi:hypothetical protein